MKVRICLAATTDRVSMFIGVRADAREGQTLVFNEGRIMPVYYYYPGECRGYVLQNTGEQQECLLPNIEGAYEILLAVRGSEVKRLEKAVGVLYEEVGALEEMPRAFWPQLGMLTMRRSFRPYMVKELYLITRQKYSLLQELEMGG